MYGEEIEVSRCMLVGVVRAGARPVFNVVHKDKMQTNEGMQTSTW